MRPHFGTGSHFLSSQRCSPYLLNALLMPQTSGHYLHTSFMPTCSTSTFGTLRNIQSTHFYGSSLLQTPSISSSTSPSRCTSRLLGLFHHMPLSRYWLCWKIHLNRVPSLMPTIGPWSPSLPISPLPNVTYSNACTQGDAMSVPEEKYFVHYTTKH